MEKEYKITEENLIKLKSYLVKIPYEYANEIINFIYSDKVLQEIKGEVDEKNEKATEEAKT